MVKNKGYITLVRIVVLVTFFLTIVLDHKSDAKETLYARLSRSKNQITNYSSLKLLADSSLIIAPPAAKNKLFSSPLHPGNSDSPVYIRYNFYTSKIQSFIVFTSPAKIRGIHPINGPPDPLSSSGNTEHQPLNVKASNQSPADSCIQIPNSVLSVFSETPLLLAVLPGREFSFLVRNEGSTPLRRSAGQAPVLECPEDISTYTDINDCSAFVSGGLNPGFDESEVVTLTWEMEGVMEDASPRGGINLIDDYTFDEGTTIITYTATGTDGTTATCIFTVTISDNQVPRLESIPADITVETAPGTCYTRVYWIEPTAIDNCTSPHLIRKESTNRPGDEFPVGTTRVYYTAYDAMGNESQVRSFAVTVRDTEAPELSLPADVTLECGSEIPAPWQTLQQLNAAGGFAADNCSHEEITFRLLSETTSSPVCPYVLTRTYQATDATGNNATATHRIVVTGTQPADAVVTEPEEEEVRLKSGMADYTAVQSGPWSDPDTWGGGPVPTAADNVTIPNGITVTVDVDAWCNDILIESGGTLNHGGAFTLQVNGNWTNNGTYNGGTNGIVEFAGTNNATISGTTIFEELIISKGTMATLLNISGNVTVGSGGSLTMNGGLVTIGTGSSLALNYSNGLSIPQTAGFDVTGGALSTGNFTITNAGLIRVNSGTANLGTNFGNSVNTQFDGAFIVSGGTVNIAGRLHNSASGTLNPPGVSSGIHISGGTVTLSTAGQGQSNTGSLNVTQAGTFNFTGGAIVFQTPSTAATELDLGLVSGTGTKNTEGGTFQFGNASTPAGATFNISSQIPLHTVTTAANASLVLENNLVVSGQLNLNGSSKLILNNYTVQIPVTGIGTYTIALDDGSGNSIPVTIQFTGGSFAAGAYVEIFTTDEKHGSNANTTNYLNRYWTIVTSGITNPVYSVDAAFTNNDIENSISEFIVGDYSGSAWNETGNATIGGNAISITGITQQSFEFTAMSEPTVSASATPEIICYGASTQLLADADGDPIVSYSWSPATGLSATNIANPVATLNSTTTYTVTVTDGNGFTAQNQITITVYDEFQPGEIASTGQTICYDENPDPIGSLTAASGGDDDIEYQWQSSPDGTTWTNISGSNSETFDPSNLTATTHFRRLAKDGTCNPFEASTGVWMVTVRSEFDPGAIETAGETICFGGTPSQIGNNSDATGGDENISYEWLSSADGYSSAIIGATSATYTPPAGLTETTSYHRYAYDGTCKTSPTQSVGTWTVTVLPELVAGSVTAAQTICHNTAPETLVATAASGGSGSFSYQWQSSPDGSSWSNISGQTALVFTSPALTSTTHYRIVATESGSPSCGTVESNVVQITVTPLLEATASATNVACFNGSATVTLSPTGGTPPYAYIFNGISDADGVINNVVAGTYSWSVTDARNCGPVTGTIVISEPTPIGNLSAGITSPITCNGGTATVKIEADGGTGTLSYTFNGQTNTTGEFSGVYAGTGLSYSVTDENGCGPVFGSIDVTEPSALSASAEITSEIECNGETATVTITASGGTGDLEYTFNGVTQPSNIFTGITPGTNIPWSVTDANGCGPVTGTLTVTQPNALTASVSETTTISCFGGTAEIRITASGGTGTKTYSFQGQPDNTTGIFTGITAGTYNWRVEDENGCFTEGTYEVQQPTQVEITSIGSNSEICQGQTLTLTSAAEGGTGNLSYSWTGPNGFTSNSPNPSIGNATPAASGTYTLTVTDANGCSAQETTDAVVHATPVVTATPSTQSVCDGDATAAITFSGATSYTWTNNNTSIGLDASGTGNIPSFTAINDGNTPVTATITVTPEGNGCSGTPITATITVNPIPELTIVNNTPTICENGMVNIILSSDVANSNISWTGSDGSSGSGTGTSLTISRNISSSVTYTIDVSANGCNGVQRTETVTVFDQGYNLLTTVLNESPDNIICTGSNFFIDFDGASPSYQTGGSTFIGTNWQWFTRFEWSINNSNVSVENSVIDLILVEPYSGTSDGDAGHISFNLVNNTDEDQEVTITLTPWAYYRQRSCFIWCGDWSDWAKQCAGASYSRTITVRPFEIICPSDISTTTDPGDCFATLTPIAPSLNCDPGTNLTWSMSDGNSGSGNISNYEFEIGLTTVTYRAQQSPSNYRECSFTVTVTDDEAPVISGCPSDYNVPMDAGECGAVITWTVPTANDNCDGVVALTRTDGTGYNNGDMFPAGTTTISYLATDAAGNTSTCSFDITVAPDDEPPVLTCADNQDECAPAGGTFTMIGTAWDATVTENCPGALTKTYSLAGATTGTGTSLNNVEFNVGTTTVTWTARDISNNEISCSFDVVVNEMPAASIAEGNQSVCLSTGSATFTAIATGTPAPTYQWYKDGAAIPGATGDELTLNNVQGTDAGSYTVEVSNSCGAAVSVPAVLTVSTPPVITAQPASQTDCFGESVLFTVTATGGETPYTWEWEMMRPSGTWIPAAGEPNITFPANGQMLVENIGDANNPSQTQYRVEITDACGNDITSSVATLTVNQITQSLVSETVCQGGNTSFSVTTSGSSPVAFEWLLNGSPISNGGPYSGATSQTLTVSNAQVSENGTYSVNVTFNITQPNNNGAGVTTCQMSADVGELFVDEGPDIVATPATQTICPGSAITEIVLTNANGTEGTTYTWTRDNTTVLTGIPASGSGETISGTLSSLDPGTPQTTTFTITATANGCVSTGTVTVTVVDDEAPIVTTGTCPADISVGADAGICGAVVTYTPPTFDDNCDGTGLAGTLVAGLAPGETFPVGTTTVTWEYADVAGNGPATCSFDVTVTDDVDPVAVCQDITVQLDASGNATIAPADVDNGSSDNCGIDNLSLDITIFNCTNLGENTVTLTVTDAAGNTHSCTATVTVADDDNPVDIIASVSQGDILCYGETTTVTISASGGVGNLTYTFNGESNGTGVFTNIPAGTDYSWSVTDEFGCGDTDGLFDVTQVDELAANIAATEVTCSSGNDGSIILSEFQGGSGNYEFSIDGGSNWQSDPAFLNLVPGIYNVQMRDADVPGCVITIHTGLEVYIITATIASTDVTCYDAADGTITITNPAGGTGPYQYSVDGGNNWQSSGSFTGLQPGTYDVRIQDDTGCEIVLDPTVNLTQPEILAATVVSTDISCNGAADGTISISSPSGGSGSFEYSVNGGTNWQTSGNFAGLNPGIYVVVIRDAEVPSCEVVLEAALEISELPEITASVNSSDVTCFGGNDGTISIVSITGGSGNYEFTIDGGTSWQTDPLFENLIAGTYNVLVRDANATICVTTLNDALVISQPPALAIDTQPLDAAVCEGENVTFSVVAAGGAGTTNYQWEKEISGVWTALTNGGNVSGANSNSLIISTVSSANNGNYRVVIADDCVSLHSDEVTLIINEIVSLIPATPDSEICEGEDFTLEVITAGATPSGYQWQVNTSGTWENISGATSGQYVISGATPAESGDYRVMVTFPATGGTECILTGDVRNLLVKPEPTVENPGDTIYCQGATTPVISLTGQPSGVVFDITGGAAIGLSNRTGVTAIPSFFAGTPGTATITITPRANGCTGEPVTFTITVDPIPNVSVAPLNQTICSGGTTNIFVSSFVPDVRYSWTYTVTSGSVTGATTANDTIITKLEETLINNTSSPATIVYHISAEKNGCSGSPTNVTITVKPAAVATIEGDATVCQGDEEPVITFTANGGAPPYTFNYNIDNGVNRQITTTSGNSVTLNVPTTDGGVFNYYLVSVTESGNCTNAQPDTVTINITPAPVLSSALTPPGICSNDVFSYIPTSDIPGTTFSWSRAEVPGISNPAGEGTDNPDEYLINTTNDPIPVVYTYTLTADGCTNTQEVVVMVTPAPVLNEYTPPNLCSGQVFSYEPTSPTSGTTFSWTRAAVPGISNPPASGTGNPNEVLINTTSSPIGVTYLYTLSSNNCDNPVTYPVVVVVIPAPNVTAWAIPTEICPGESVNLFSTSDIVSSKPPVLLEETFNSATSGSTNGPNGWTTTNNSSGGTPANARWTVRPNNYNYGGNISSNDNSNFYMANSAAQGGGGGASTLTTLVSPVINTEGYTSLTMEFYDYYRDNGVNSGDYAYIDISTNGGTTWTQINPPGYNANTSHGTRTNFARQEINLNAYINNSNFRIRFRYVATRDYYWAIDNVTITGTPAAVADILWTSNTSSWTSTEADPTNVVVNETTTFTATYTDPDTDCPGSASVTVTVKDPPNAYIHANYCYDPGSSLIELTALGGATGATYLWDTGATTQSIYIDEVSIYSVTITNPDGCSATAYLNVSNELVVNGDFEAGNTGFTSGYGFRPSWTYPAYATTAANSSLWDENYFGIGTNGRYYHTNFWGRDHTSGTGNFMIVNGNLNAGTPIWEQVVNVEPNTNYYFSAWAMSLNSAGNDAVLQFEVNGVLVGTQARLPAGVSNESNNGWIRFYSNPLWNSGSVSGPITIRIRNVEPAAGGNDFGLDDISFGTLDPFPLIIDVTADEVCEGDTLFLYSNSEFGLEPITYNWTGPNGWTSNEANPKIPNVSADLHNGTYHLAATDGYGCDIVPDEVTVTVNPAPTVDAGEDQTVCTANPVVYLNGIIGGSATSATWSGGTGTFDDPGIPDATYTLSEAETTEGFVKLYLTTNDPDGPCNVVTDSVIVTIYNSLEIEVETESPYCFLGEDGSATATVTVESTGPYTWLWSDGQTTQTATGLSSGEYWVTVTDANGCTASDTIEITEPEPFVIAGLPEVIPPSCYGAADGMAVIHASGGTEPYQIIWDANAGNQENDTAFYLSAGLYTVFVSDSAGCAATNFTVVVPQPLEPTLTCPPDAEDIIHDDGCGITFSTIENPVVTGFCFGDTTYVRTGATSDSGTGLVNDLEFNVGTTIVEYTVTDTVGNSLSCSFEVTVRRLEIPETTITCPEPYVEVDVDEASCEATLTSLLPPGITDPCNEIDSVWNNSPYRTSPEDANGMYPVGTTVFQWIILDVSGNTDTCEVTVVVNDTIPPFFVNCPEDATDVAAPGNCSAVPGTLTEPEYDDACSNAELTYTRQLPDGTTDSGSGSVTSLVFPVGTTTVTYTITDESGNSATCEFTVTIVDVTPPNLTIGCEDIVEEAAPNNCSKIPATLPDPVYSDDCWPVDSLTLTWTMTGATEGSGSGSVKDSTFNVGVTTVVYTVTDPDGNFATCEFTVTIVDVTPPNLTIGCEDVTEIAGPNDCYIIPATISEPVYSDDCWDVADLTLTWEMTGATVGTGSGSVANENFNVGVTTVTYTVTDPDDNTANCSFDVTILHDEVPDPSFDCPVAYHEFDVDPVTCDATITLDAMVILDPCNEIDLYWNESPYRTDSTNASGTYPVGTTVFYWYITDISGNIDSCEVTVVVNDNIEPTIDCPPDIADFADIGENFATNISPADPVVGDNCNPGDLILTWELVPPSGFESEYDVSELSGTGIYPAPNTFWLGVTTITYTVTDLEGNSASCSFTVTIQTAPVIECPPDTTVYADENCIHSFNPGVPELLAGAQPITWTYTINGNDPVVFVGSEGNPGPPDIGSYDFPIGVTIITWRAENIAGHDECQQIITVIDNTVPTFVPPPDAFEDCVDMLHSAVYDPANPNPVINHTDPILNKYPSPDFHTFDAGNTALDLDMSNYADNCCDITDTWLLRWQIDFTDVPNPLAAGNISNPPITGIGQPSAHGSDIQLWGNGVYFIPVTHTITYWITDCHGNESDPIIRDITITPRPQIIKVTGP